MIISLDDKNERFYDKFKMKKSYLPFRGTRVSQMVSGKCCYKNAAYRTSLDLRRPTSKTRPC